MQRSFRQLVFWVSISAVGAAGVPAQVPPEVDNLSWCPGSRSCLTWSAVPEAAAYVLYRGGLSQIAGIVDGMSGACAMGSYAGLQADTDIHTPAGGQWYLVTASSGAAEGSAGSGTTAPRLVAGSEPCQRAPALLINEVDYDQPGVDAREFIEIVNTTDSAQDLSDLVLVLVNGSTGQEYARVALASVGVLPGGGYLVAGSATVLADLPQGMPAVALAASSNNIQNGAPDGIALVDAEQGLVIDVLAYEGTIVAAQIEGLAGPVGLTRGNPAVAVDPSNAVGAIGRRPNAHFSGDDATDWSFVEIPTPGEPNPAD